MQGGCWRVKNCKIAGPGCRGAGAENNCDLLLYIEKEIARMASEISGILARKRKRLYFERSEKWYQNLKQKALKVMTEKEFLEAENKAIEMFFAARKKKGEKRHGL